MDQAGPKIAPRWPQDGLRMAPNITNVANIFSLAGDNAPIIPSERKKLEDIAFVITRAIGGNKTDSAIMFCLSKYLL